MPLFKSLGNESINRVNLIKPNEIQFTTDIKLMKLNQNFSSSNYHWVKMP